MSLKSDYVEYALQAVLSILAVTSIALVDTSKTLTYIYLLTLPLLLAYTAYISSDSFQNSSLTAFITAFFIPLGPIYALGAVFVIFSNIFVSYFSKGESFGDFYSSITLPLLFTGLILGVFVFAFFTLQPDAAQQTSAEASEILSQQTQDVNEKLGINSTEARTDLLETVSTLTVSMTHSYVISSTSGQLSPQDMQNVSNAFNEAETEIPSRIVEQASQQTPDVQNILSSIISNILSGPLLFVVIPLIAGLIYAFNPVLGLSTAFIGVIIRRIDGYFSETA